MAMFKTLSFLFVLCFEIHGTVGLNFTLSFDTFVKSQNKSVALFGDSKLVNDSSSIQLTDSVSGSVGRVFYREPINLFQVDLPMLWKGGEIMVGLSSANGNSSKAHFLHSWSFETRHLHLMWVHSVPLEQNEGLKADVSTEEEEGRERSECIWRMLGALVLGAVCGAIGAMLALYLLTICGVRLSMAVVPEECAHEQGKK